VFRTAAQRIRFYPIRPDELTARLSEVARSERILLAPGALPAIVSRAHGDLRAALNDLEAIAPLPAGPLQLEVLGGRDRTADFAELTAEALSVARLYRSGEVRDRLDAPPDDLLPWIEENIVHFAPDPAHRASAFRTLAVAEQFLSRARRFRTYGQWSYASELLTGGVGLTIRDRPIPAVGEAAFPRFLGEMGRSGAMRAVRESLVAKIAGRFHLSRKKVRATLLWELEGIFGAGRGGARSRRALIGATAIARELELTPEEVAFLLATAPGDPGVAAILGPGPEGSSPGTMDTAEGERSPEESPPQAPTDEATERAKKPVQRRLGEFPP
jgi:replication factor C large subunit